MKRTIMFIALYSVAFMFPSIGSVDTAVADPGAHTSMGAPAPFDDGLMGAPSMSGAAITGNDSVVCGDLPGKLLETNCLRDVLDASEFDVRTEKQKENGKRGQYGCGNSDRATHTGCLRGILHSNDNTMAPGTN